MLSTAAMALWKAFGSSYIAKCETDINSIAKKVWYKARIYEVDSAASNKKFLAARLVHERALKWIVWWLFCGQHLHHIVQGVFLTRVRGCMEIMSCLYSGSALLRGGTTWNRFIEEALLTVVAKRLSVKPWPPPPAASELMDTLYLYVCEGFGGLGTSSKHLAKTWDLFGDFQWFFLE